MASGSTRTSPMPTYVATVDPIMTGDLSSYLSRELTALQEVLKGIQALTPQPAIKAPDPQDGMIRLSRAPWRPLTGQTTDQWVSYDIATRSWVPFPQ